MALGVLSVERTFFTMTDTVYGSQEEYRSE
jgi:hypothetical protein